MAPAFWATSSLPKIFSGEVRKAIGKGLSSPFSFGSGTVCAGQPSTYLSFDAGKAPVRAAGLAGLGPGLGEGCGCGWALFGAEGFGADCCAWPAAGAALLLL